jgi:hypothetical protein
MSIRAMTDDEIRKALRRGAEVAIETQDSDWGWYNVLPADDAYDVAVRFDKNEWVNTAESPEHAAMFLLLCAEAY